VTSVAVPGSLVRSGAVLRSVRVRWQVCERQLHGHWGRTHQHREPTDELPVSAPWFGPSGVSVSPRSRLLAHSTPVVVDMVSFTDW
jgi:hypothetical protein